MRSKPAVIAVSGVKNSGKTTLIERLLPLLSAAGVRTAVIKHDGHAFLPEPPGTDTGRCLAAGACGAAIFDGEKFKVIRRAAVDETALIGFFPEADLILLEGFKGAPWPKLEVVRSGNSDGPVCDPSTLLALVTDLPLTLPGVPVLPLDDPSAVAAAALDYVNQERGELHA